MKRHGFLFDEAFSRESLYNAWLVASKGKLNRRACLAFSKRLAENLDALYDELHSDTYKPRPYITFQVYEPKQRNIYAPAFRDLVVQHAIYRTIYPIYDSGLIDQSFACRKGKGTHRASDYAQSALRKCKPGTYVIKFDIRKFFYRIDRTILRRLLEAKIKDQRLLKVMLAFADYGEPVGIPIGNLLSQLYATIYMNPLDHFIKRTLKAKLYCRYVDDFIIFGWSYERCLFALQQVKDFLTSKLNLELSKYTLQPINRGVNFVGYRTWRSTRFIRKHSLRAFMRSAKHNRIDGIISILGHAHYTASMRHLLNTLKEHFHDLYYRLPQIYQRYSHQRTTIA